MFSSYSVLNGLDESRQGEWDCGSLFSDDEGDTFHVALPPSPRVDSTTSQPIPPSKQTQQHPHKFPNSNALQAYAFAKQTEEAGSLDSFDSPSKDNDGSEIMGTTDQVTCSDSDVEAIVREVQNLLRINRGQREVNTVPQNFQAPVQPAPVSTDQTDIDVLTTRRWPPMPPKEDPNRDEYVAKIHRYAIQLGIWDADHPLLRQDPGKDGKVKRPMNSFLLFLRVWSPHISWKSREKKLNGGQLTPTVSVLWRALSADKRSVYDELARKHTEIFKNKNANFKYHGAKSRAKRGLPPKNRSASKASRSQRGVGEDSRAHPGPANGNFNGQAQAHHPAQNLAYDHAFHARQQQQDLHYAQLLAPPLGFQVDMGQRYPQFQDPHGFDQFLDPALQQQQHPQQGVQFMDPALQQQQHHEQVQFHDPALQQQQDPQQAQFMDPWLQQAQFLQQPEFQFLDPYELDLINRLYQQINSGHPGYDGN